MSLQDIAARLDRLPLTRLHIAVAALCAIACSSMWPN